MSEGVISAGGIAIDINATTNLPAVARDAGAALGRVGDAAGKASTATKALEQQMTVAAKSTQILYGGGRALAEAWQGNVAAAFASVIPVVGMLREGIKSLSVGMLALLSNPITWMIAAAAALVAGVAALVKSYREAQDATDDWAKHTARLKTALTDLSDSQVTEGIERLRTQLLANGEVTDDMQALYSRLAVETTGNEKAARQLAAALSPMAAFAEKYNVATRDQIHELQRDRATLDQLKESMAPGFYERAAQAIDDKLNAALGRTREAAAKATAEVQRFRDYSGSDLLDPGLEGPSMEGLDDLMGAVEPAPGADIEARGNDPRFLRMLNQETAYQQARIDAATAAKERMWALQEEELSQRSALMQDFTSGMAAAWGQLWSDLVTGQAQGGKALLGQVLNLIGSLAIQMGTFGILSGLMFTAIPFLGLSGGAAVGAGAALVAFGGALKGAGALVSGGASQAAGGGSGSLTSAYERETGVRRPGEASSGGNVTINVNTGQTLATRDDVALAVAEGVDRAHSLGWRGA